MRGARMHTSFLLRSAEILGVRGGGGVEMDADVMAGVDGPSVRTVIWYEL